MSSCEAVRERLAEGAVDAADEVVEIKRHLQSCASCTKFLSELRRVESALRDLPSHDAPDAVVAETLRAVRQAANERDVPARPGATQRNIAAGLAAAAVITAGLGLTFTFLEPSYESVVVQRNLAAPRSDVDFAETAARPNRGYAESADTRATRRDLGDDITESFETAQLGLKKAKQDQFRLQQEGERRSGEPGSYRYAERPFSDAEVHRELDVITLLDAQDFDRQEAARAAQEPLEKDSERARNVDAGARAVPTTTTRGATSPPRLQFRIGAGQIVNEPLAREKTGYDALESRLDLADDKSFRTPAQNKDAGAEISATAAVGEVGKSEPSAQPVGGLSGGILGAFEIRRRGLVPPADPRRAHLLASRFLNDYQSLERLSYQDPTGYWANTYIPGDPAMRLLQARLRAWDRSVLGQDVRLEQAVQQVHQPFDGPQDAALAVYLGADTPSIDGRTRFRVQVGLKGAERQGGHRPAMNVALVVDLRGVTDADSGARIRALVLALERARRPGDRLSLTVAGPDGGLLVPPAEFRHGPLLVAMERMLGTSKVAAASNVDLRQAFTLATESVLEGDDPGAVLGSSLVLLVTGSSLAEDLSELERMAHRNAVGGVTLSVVSLVAREDLEQIDRLVAAGQGNRRILGTATAADSLIDRELHAASRSVARAVRLRIRLAQGVKLVDVIGSRRLRDSRAQLVREAEQAIDRRLARNLGIQLDRGADEEGIQIVIPNFYAGDTHTILLDVVAEGPGPVADVTVRYKDVIYLKNGVARANLTVGGGQAAAGPLEMNVLKNLVAQEFARQARQVGRALAGGDPRTAARRLASLRDLIHGLRLEVAGWQGDPDLIADQAMLDAYLAVLATPAARDPDQRQFLADSLRLAAFRKLQTAAR